MNGAALSGLVTISGTAADVGGAVAGVEVSVDGGKRWHPVTAGTDRWTFEWQVPEGSGSATIMSRASDDSVNVETPRRGIVVRYGPPTETTADATR